MAAGLIALALIRTGVLAVGPDIEWGPALFAAGALAGTALALFLLEAPRHPGLYGFRGPLQWRWLWLAPVVVAAALAGGAWPPDLGPASELARPASLVAILLLPLAAELAFRSLAQGFLHEHLKLTMPERLLSLSWPTVISALFFAIWTLPLHLVEFGLDPTRPIDMVRVFFAALVLGVAQGMCRESTESVIGPILLHYLGVATAASLLLLG